MGRQDLHFEYGDDPLVVFTCTKDRTPIDLTTLAVVVYIKADRFTADSAADKVYSSTSTANPIIIEAPTTTGRADVQFLSTDLGTPTAPKWYKLIVITSGLKRTYSYGNIFLQPT